MPKQRRREQLRKQSHRRKTQERNQMKKPRNYVFQQCYNVRGLNPLCSGCMWRVECEINYITTKD